MKHLFRKGAAGATLLTLLAAAACGTSPDAADDSDPVVDLAYSEGIYINLPVYLAQQQGLFEKHGVTVNDVRTPAGAQVIQSVATDSAEVGLQTPATMQSTIEAGDELQSFCGVTDGQTNYILGPPDTNLPSTDEAGGRDEAIRAMNGQTIGVPALGGVITNSLDAITEDVGVSMDSAAIGAGPSAVAAFENRNVDLVWGYPFIAQQLLAEGKAKVLVDFAKDGPASIGNNPTVLFAKSDWLDQNEEAATRMCAAVTESIELLRSEEGAEPVAQILDAQFGVREPAVLDLISDPDMGVLRLFTTKLPTCDEWKTAIEIEKNAGSFEGTEDCDGYFRDLTE